MNLCKKCKAEFSPEAGLVNYCSLSCRNSRNWSDTDRLKKSVAGRRSKRVKDARDARLARHIYKSDLVSTLVCVVCNLSFTSKNSQKKTCTDKCRSKLLSTIASEQKKHGTGKAGYYHGVWCDSSYELIFIYTHPDAVRCNLRIPYTKANGVSSTYTPDFMLDGRIYEIKGYLTENDHLKQSAARKLGIDITLLYDIEWFTTTKKEIEKTHNIANIWELYDDYKPKFTYTCSNCTKQYVTDAEKQTTKTYCSRRCAGQYMRQQNTTKNN